jgi:predicted RNase H-like HicB family nuclease
MTTATLIIHLDNADGEVVWWAESPEAPGFTAAASSLVELRELALNGLRDLISPAIEVAELLVGSGHQVDVQVDSWGRRVNSVRELVA